MDKCKPSKSLAEQVIEHKEFVELVRKMREAQDKVGQMDNDTWDEDVYKDMCRFESEVDKRIKILGA